MSFYTANSLTFSYTRVNKLFEDISFEIEKNPLKAYIVNANNKLDLYKIMDEDGYESVYYTIDEWNKISGEDGF